MVPLERWRKRFSDVSVNTDESLLRERRKPIGLRIMEIAWDESNAESSGIEVICVARTNASLQYRSIAAKLMKRKLARQ